MYQNCCAGTWGRASDNTCPTCSTCRPGYTLTAACTTIVDTTCRGNFERIPLPTCIFLPSPNDCPNPNYCTFILRVTLTVDITPPLVTLLGANPQTTEAGVAWVNPGAVASDFIDGVITTITITPSSGVNIMQLGAQTVGLVVFESHLQIVYSAVDTAGNTGSASRVVNVVDTQPPTLTLLATSPYVWEANVSFVVSVPT